MSGETEKNVSGWTTDTLKAYIDQRLTDIDKAVQAALAAAEKAVRSERESSQQAIEKSEKNAEKWRESANEWRGAMDDRERTFATIKDLEAAKLRLDEVRDAVNRVADLARGTISQKDNTRIMWLAIGSGVIVLIALWRVFTGN